MTFHKEGYPTLILILIFIGALNGGLFFLFPDLYWILLLFKVLSLVLLVIVVQFFRSPNREWNKGDNKKIISPADGTVVVIEEVEENEYFNDKRLQVSIFMSPLNVHINRNPIGGIVKLAKYHPGKYLMAINPKSSTENERTSVVIETPEGNAVLFRQVAGALARRIVYYCKEGDKVEQTNQMGFIKFGSRVDLYLPIDTKLNVNLNDVVKGGITELANFK
jgi:phosphatidylserine decarboxylase